MIVQINEEDIQSGQIKKVIDVLQSGGVIIYPTDTIYGFGCDIFQQKAIEQICRIKHIQPSKANLSFICDDLGHLSQYAKQLANPIYRLLKDLLPGPYTFILPASKQVPKILKTKKDTIGLRIPDNNIARTIVRELGHPLVSTSLPGENAEELVDPEIIHNNFGNQVNLVVDGGIGGLIPSTVIDCTGSEPILIRQGLGPWTA